MAAHKAAAIIVEEKDNDFLVTQKSEEIATKREYLLFLGDRVDLTSKYAKLLAFLKNISEDDTLFLQLANFGGACHGCVALVGAIKECKAKVVVEVLAPCYSAGATLALSGDALIMKPHTYLMFHNYGSMLWGKGDEMTQKLKASNKWIHGYFKDLHEPFLTHKETESIINDKDLYVHWDSRGIKGRIKRHFKK